MDSRNNNPNNQCDSNNKDKVSLKKKKSVRREKMKDLRIVLNRKVAEVVPGLERTPGGGNGNPLQYSCMENRK